MTDFTEPTKDLIEAPALAGEVTGQRDSRGLFVKGNKGGPGRPRRAVEKQYYRATIESCSLKDWARAIRRAVADADDPNPLTRDRARSFLLKALFGTQPGAVVQINTIAEPQPKPKPDFPAVMEMIHRIYGIEPSSSPPARSYAPPHLSDALPREPVKLVPGEVLPDDG